MNQDYVTLRMFQALIEVSIDILEESCFCKIFTYKNDLTNKNLFLKAKWYTRWLFSNVLACRHLGKRTTSGKSPPWDASNSESHELRKPRHPPLFTTILMRTEGRGWGGGGESPGKTA